MIKNLIFRIVDILTLKRGLKVTISGVNLRLPSRYFRYYGDSYEEESIMQMRKSVKKGDVVLDIGAQLGLMTKFFSDQVGVGGKVYAFEPTPSTFDLLCKTIEINNISKIATPIKKAVTDRVGEGVFNVSDTEASPANSLSNYERIETKGIKVYLTSVDVFVKENNLDKIDFIKIDAEGAEYSVLKGAKETIAAHHPKILLAMHPESIVNFGNSLVEIWDFIMDKNYKVFLEEKEITKSSFIEKTDLFDVHLFPYS